MHKNKNIILKNKSENLFQSIVHPSIHSYLGFSFEKLCEDAMEIILEKIDVALSEIIYIGPYFQQKTTVSSGVQIDQLILRRDSVLNILEFKYSKNPIGANIIKEIEHKILALNIPKNWSIEKILIASNGVTSAVKEAKYFTRILTIEDLIS